MGLQCDISRGRRGVESVESTSGQISGQISRQDYLVRLDRLWCGVLWWGVLWCGVLWCGVCQEEEGEDGLSFDTGRAGRKRCGSNAGCCLAVVSELSSPPTTFPLVDAACQASSKGAGSHGYAPSRNQPELISFTDSILRHSRQRRLSDAILEASVLDRLCRRVDLMRLPRGWGVSSHAIRLSNV